MRLLMLPVLLVFVAACSSRQVYDSAHGLRMNQCNKIFDRNEQERCMQSADKTYDDYQQQKAGNP